MYRNMNEKEHKYFHELIFVLSNAAEPKFARGAAEHRDKGDLWDMPDAALDAAIQEELTDLMIYNAEKLRRRRARKDK